MTATSRTGDDRRRQLLNPFPQKQPFRFGFPVSLARRPHHRLAHVLPQERCLQFSAFSAFPKPHRCSASKTVALPPLPSSHRPKALGNLRASGGFARGRRMTFLQGQVKLTMHGDRNVIRSITSIVPDFRAIPKTNPNVMSISCQTFRQSRKQARTS